MSTELTISPEGLDIAHAYLECKSDARLAAEKLNLPLDEVARYLNKREVKQYVDQLYFESGFRNRDRMGAVMDEIIAAKLEELDETGMGSTHDIVDILEKFHKMKMKEMEMAIKMQQETAPHIQVNQQINNTGGDNYNRLLEKLLGEK